MRNIFSSIKGISAKKLSKAKDFIKNQKDGFKGLGTMVNKSEQIYYRNGFLTEYIFSILNGLKEAGIKKIPNVTFKGNTEDVIVNDEIKQLKEDIKKGKQFVMEKP